MSSINLSQQYNSASFSRDTVAAYLREIGRFSLLKDSEEIILGKEIQQMMSLLNKKEKLEQKKQLLIDQKEWAEAIGLTEKELNQTLRKGFLAKNKMIRANLRLVVSIAKKYVKRNVEFMDLIQEGNLGLERAVEKFDPSKGYRFSTYAYWWIRQAITRAIAQQARTIRLPIHITEKLNKIKKTQRQLAVELGRSATTTEIAKELGITLDEVREYIKIAQHPASLDVKVGDSSNTNLSELIEDNSSNPLDSITRDSMKYELAKILAELNSKEREIVSLRFGLFDGKEWTLEAIGEKLNLSREGVRQLQNRALLRLRNKNLSALRIYLVS